MRHHKAIAVISLLGSILVFSQASLGQGTFVQTIDTSAFIPPSPDTSGVVYLPTEDRLLAADSEVNEIPTLFTGDNLFEIDHVTPALIRTGTTAFSCDPANYSCEPTGLSYNSASQRVLISDDARDRIFEVDEGLDGLYGTTDDVITSLFRTREFASFDPEDVTYCPDDGRIYIGDGINLEVYIVDPGGDGIFGSGNGITLGTDDVVTQFDVAVIGMLDLEGIACDVDHTVALGFSADHLYLSGEPDDTVFHATTDGTLVRTITVLAAAKKLAGLALGPSSLGAGDSNPALLNLYIADRGVDNNTDPDENDGMIYEYSLTGLTAPNNSPTVDAGPDQMFTTTPPVVVNLDGTVSDEGVTCPCAGVTTTWDEVSGPPGASFANLSAIDTTVTLPAVGIYKLTLTADDGEFQPFAEVTIEVQEPTGGISTIYVSTSSPASPPGLSFEDEDIAAFDLGTQTWSMYFDGSDVGLSGGGRDVNAFSVESDGSVLLALNVAHTLPGVGLVDRSDVVRFIPTSTGDTTAGTYEMVLDGSDVELASSGERIDAIGVLPLPDGRIVISTTGNFSALGVSAKDEDLVVFTGTLGEATSGSWAVYVDGSDVELKASSEDVNGAWVDANGDIYLSTVGNFTVTGASGDGLDTFTCVPVSVGPSTSCTYNPLFFDGSANGLTGAGKVDGISLGR